MQKLFRTIENLLNFGMSNWTMMMMMKEKMNNIFAVLFITVMMVGLPRMVYSSSTCSVSDSEKKDCGYFGIDQASKIYNKMYS